jgi:hypothetical protein
VAIVAATTTYEQYQNNEQYHHCERSFVYFKNYPSKVTTPEIKHVHLQMASQILSEDGAPIVLDDECGYNGGSRTTTHMPKKPATRTETDDNVLVSAAKAIGSAAGKIASLAGATPEARPPAKSTKVGKLPKKQGHRLPRRQKKAAQKTPPSSKG